MSLKALRKGSTCPVRKDDSLLRLYSMRLCPYVQRVRLVLVFKGIPFEEVNVHLNDKPEWYFEKNPFGKVPTLEFEDKIIYESLICMDYLEEVYPEPKLTPVDPYVKARQRMVIDRFNQVISKQYVLFRGDDEEQLTNDLLSALQYFEDNLKSPYFGGDTVQMVDLAVWPWFDRLGAVPLLRGNTFSLDKLPNLKNYTTRMQELEFIKKTSCTAEAYFHIEAASKRGEQYDPDFGL